MVEGAIVLGVATLLLLGTLELSLVLVRRTSVCEAARRVGREAIVHGEMAAATQGTWGPAEFELSADGNHAAAAIARTALVMLPAADVQLRLTWPDASTLPGRRVCSEVAYTHYPLLPIPGWYTEIELTAKSTMLIAH
jgi:hypothetical protein